MSYSFAFDQDELVKDYLTRRIGIADWGPCATMAIYKDGQFIAGFLYSQYRGYDIELSGAAEKGALNDDTIRAVFAYPFVQLGCRRVTATISKKNVPARKRAVQMGFKLEGVMRKAHFTGADLCVYGMLNTECRWTNGQKLTEGTSST